MINEEGGSGCRCLYTLERNHIQHTLVPFMSYSRDDRQREVCHILGKRQGVETRKIARSTTTTDDDYAVKLFPFGIDTVEGSNHALLYPLALHRSRKETGLKLQTIIVIGKLVAEITITCCRCTGNDGDALAEHRECQLLLQFEYALCFQRIDDFQPLARHIAHRIVRVNIVYYPGEAIVLMKLRVYLEQHFHSCMNALSGDALEIRFDEHPSVSPAGGMRLGNGRIRALILLDEFQIAVPAVALASLGEFRFHPIAVGQGHRNDLTDYGV